MKRMMGLLACAGIVAGGGQAEAQQAGKVSLKQAIDAMLANGCTGAAGSGGLLAAGDITTTARSITDRVSLGNFSIGLGSSDLANNPGARLGNVDSNGVASVWTPQNILATDLVRFAATTTEGGASIPQLTQANGFTATYASTSLTNRIAVTQVIGQIRGVSPDGTTTVSPAYAEGWNDVAGGTLNSPANRESPEFLQGRAAAQAVLARDGQVDPLNVAPGYVPVQIIPGAAFTQSATGLAIGYDVTVSRTATLDRGARSGLLAASLGSLCRSTSTATTTTTFRGSGEVGPFNLYGGLRSQAGSGSASVGLGAAGAAGSGSGLGVAALRAQDSVARREKGVFAFFERLKRKSQNKRAGLMGVQLASNDPAFLPAAADVDRLTIVTDLVGGVVNIDNSATSLEGAYGADSGYVNAGAALTYEGVFSSTDAILFGFAGGYETTDTTAEGAGITDRGDSEATSWNASALLGWTSPPVSAGFAEPMRATVSLALLYGEGDQDYTRTFSATPASGAAALTDILSGSSEQTFSSNAIHASLAQPIGVVTLTPRASFSVIHVETDGFSESLAGGDQGGDGGLSLRYAPVEDDWTEARLGAGASFRAYETASMAVDLGAGVDFIHVGSPESSTRIAYFVQDLRGASSAPILYNVNDLDSDYYDLSASASALFANGAELILSGFSRQGHSYSDVTGLQAGVRLTF
jgi:hypothetical protein